MNSDTVVCIPPSEKTCQRLKAGSGTGYNTNFAEGAVDVKPYTEALTGGIPLTTIKDSANR